MSQITYEASVNKITTIGTRAYVTAWCFDADEYLHFPADVDDAPCEGDLITVTFEWGAAANGG